MIICGIETSCDETSVSFVRASGGLRRPRFEVLSNVVSSQVKLHAQYGGVMPLLAARKHGENIDRIFSLALRHAGAIGAPNLIAATYGPGLMPSLLVGVNFARSFSYFSGIPLVGVNHLEGHMYANLLEVGGVSTHQLQFPALALIVSGGHTELVYMKGYGIYRIIGQTLDDAAGECFDKGARLLHLGYPGGPAIDALARQGNPLAYPFPSPMIFSKNYDFSFSGLKTSLLYFLRDHHLDFSGRVLSAKRERVRADIAASFQHAVVKVLVAKTMRAAAHHNVHTVCIGGGVAANSHLQKEFQGHAGAMRILFPRRTYITDNAAMIAVAGYIAHMSGKRSSWKSLDPEPNLQIGGK